MVFFSVLMVSIRQNWMANVVLFQEVSSTSILTGYDLTVFIYANEILSEHFSSFFFFCLFSFCWLVLLAFKTTLAFPSNYQTVSAFRVWFREGSHTRCDCANCVVNMGNVVALLGTCMSLLWQWLVLLGSLSLTNQVERVENEIWRIP